eukprot:TRINITY_DN14770_c0_g1_i1.p5 TRINITY_DN14770_c0_g1~~TRINITY_DN14770_c0_g1_i1.p5  ORF type:complete len:159 (-),score=10.47 TRINITY_DN14770_c0_g1_i1:345-821(-)
MRYIDRLIQNCQHAKKALPVKEFELQKLSDLDSLDNAIYIIEEIGGDINKTFEDFKKYRNKKERSCSKLNAPSNTMYVGSSTTGIRKRIEQHIGDGHKSTYALHLKHWFKGKYKITIKQYNVTRDILQIIEDDLSDQLSPAFGKQGSNNKLMWIFPSG